MRPLGGLCVVFGLCFTLKELPKKQQKPEEGSRTFPLSEERKKLSRTYKQALIKKGHAENRPRRNLKLTCECW